jgi:hypothetical protein
MYCTVPHDMKRQMRIYSPITKQRITGSIQLRLRLRVRMLPVIPFCSFRIENLFMRVREQCTSNHRREGYKGALNIRP